MQNQGKQLNRQKGWIANIVMVSHLAVFGFAFGTATVVYKWSDWNLTSHTREALSILDASDSIAVLKHDLALPWNMLESRRKNIALERAGIVAGSEQIASEAPSLLAKATNYATSAIEAKQSVTQIINNITNNSVKAALTEQELVDLVSASETLKNMLKGDKGDRGEKGDSGLSIGFTSPTSSNPGSYGGTTFSSAKTFSADTLTVTSSISLPNSSITFSHWTSNSCTTDQIAKFNGTAWACATDAGGVNDAQYLTLATNATLTNERVLTGTANQVVLTDAGAGGNLTLSLPQSIHTGATPTFAGLTLNNTGFKLNDTDASHTLTITPGSNLSAGRTLTITTGDADRTITLNGSPTLNDWFDQSVKSTVQPSFAGVSITGGSGVAGSLVKSATNGIQVWGITGSSYDWTMLDNAGNHILNNPTGTRNVNIEAGDLIFGANKVIRRNTSDGSDSGSVILHGGGSASRTIATLQTQGAVLLISGNEESEFGYVGQVNAWMGNVANAQFNIYRSDAANVLKILGSDGSATFTSSNDDAWTFNSTNNNGPILLAQRSGTNLFQLGSDAVIAGGNNYDTTLKSTAAASAIRLQAGTNSDHAVVLNPGNGAFHPRTDNTLILGVGGVRWSVVHAANGTIQTSDARLKTNVNDSDLGLEFIKTLRPVSYNWIDKDNGTHYGLIAQEVQGLAPIGSNFVADAGDGSWLGMNYAEFIAPLINAVQELDEKLSNMSVESIASINNKWSISEDGVLIAKEVRTEKLCVKKSNGIDVCITGDELEALLGGSGVSQSSSGGQVAGESTEQGSADSVQGSENTETSEESVVEETSAEESASEPETTPESASEEVTP